MSKWILGPVLGAVLFAIASTLLAAEAPPETVVDISIYDLVGKPKIKSAPHLPADYGKKVAVAIQASKQDLNRCLTQPGESRLSFSLKIAGDGKASVAPLIAAANESAETASCLVRVLGAVTYPVHQLKKPVSIELPIHLRRKVL